MNLTDGLPLPAHTAMRRTPGEINASSAGRGINGREILARTTYWGSEGAIPLKNDLWGFYGAIQAASLVQLSGRTHGTNGMLVADDSGEDTGPGKL